MFTVSGCGKNRRPLVELISGDNEKAGTGVDQYGSQGRVSHYLRVTSPSRLPPRHYITPTLNTLDTAELCRCPLGWKVIHYHTDLSWYFLVLGILIQRLTINWNQTNYGGSENNIIWKLQTKVKTSFWKTLMQGTIIPTMEIQEKSYIIIMSKMGT